MQQKNWNMYNYLNINGGSYLLFLYVCRVSRDYLSTNRVFWTVKVEYLRKKIWKNQNVFKHCRKVLRILSFKCDKKILKTSKDIPKKHFKIWKSEGTLRIWEQIRDLKIEIQNRNLKKVENRRNFGGNLNFFRNIYILTVTYNIVLVTSSATLFYSHCCTLVNQWRIYVTKTVETVELCIVEHRKITNVTFRHEGVFKIICPRKLEKYFSRWKMKLQFRKKIRCWDFCFKCSRFFHIFIFWDFFQEFQDFFRFSFFFKKKRFSDFRFFGNCQCFFQNVEIFQIFKSFRHFGFSNQINF